MTTTNKRNAPLARIAGTGRAVPPNVLTNADLEAIVDTNDEWITQRTGVKRRHIVQRGTKTSDLCIEAARIAMEDAHVGPDDIEFIILGTISPDMRFPATAIFVQEALKCENAVAYDVSATCSGFLFSLFQGEAMIALGRAKTGLVIGAELLTTITDWTDRGSCVLFGDGAGAVVLTQGNDERGILSTYIGSGGNASSLLYSIGHGTAGHVGTMNVEPGESVLRMNGNKVFPYAVRSMEKAAVVALERAGIGAAELDWLIPHQANIRIIESTMQRLHLPAEKVIINIQEYGNTSSASIPIALDEAVRDGRIRHGHNVLLAAFGGGFTWGGAVIRF